MTAKLIFRVTSSALVLAAVLIACAGCGRGAAQPPLPPPSVTVAPVEEKEIVEWDEFTGRIEPVESVEVRPRVSGYIQEVKFQSGQLVKKGEVLFVIDPRWHQAEFDRRQAEYEQAKVRLENARREADRTTQLLANNAISIEDSDARQARFQEAKALLLAAQAAVESARLDLEYTQIRAPIDGRVSRALLTEGNYVSGVAGASTVLTTLVSVDPIYVYADIDENSLLKFNALAHARKLETNGAGDADGRMVPGLFARIRVPGSARHPVLLVAERAIGTDQAQKFVLALTSTNTIAYRSVKLGPVVQDKRVIRSGLDAGEKIVVNGLQRVRPGMPVSPQEAIAEGATPGLQTARR